MTTLLPYHISDDSAALPNQWRLCCFTTPVSTLLPYHTSDDSAALPHTPHMHTLERTDLNESARGRTGGLGARQCDGFAVSH